MSAEWARRMESTPPPTVPSPAMPIPTSRMLMHSSRMPHFPSSLYDCSTAFTWGVTFPSTTT